VAGRHTLQESCAQRFAFTPWMQEDDVVFKKAHFALVPTGCGKTISCPDVWLNASNVPFAGPTRRPLTEAGLRPAKTLGNIFVEAVAGRRLLTVKRAETGIIYVDEIDKIWPVKTENPSITRDVSGEGVTAGSAQGFLRKPLRSVPPQGGRKIEQEFIQIDTTMCLFNCWAGAFAGLEEIFPSA